MGVVGVRVNWFWLYRPTVPSVRAQAIQVVHMAHAMASRGHEVHLAVDPAPGQSSRVEAMLGFYGLEPITGLHLHTLSPSRTVASVQYRALVARWIVATRGRGVLYARSKRYAREALRVFGRRFRLFVEAHEVDSLQAEERGADPGPLRALESVVLGAASGIVTNCPGTLALLRAAHPHLPPAIAIHNATHEGRIRRPVGPGQGIGYVGSVRAYKDLACVARAAASCRLDIHLVGPRPEQLTDLQTLAGGRLIVEPELPHRDVPDRLAKFRALVLPLGRGLFGERLTSPLKLWDYLASGVPIVAADLPSVRDAAPGMYVPYEPGDASSLAAALDRIAVDEELRARVLGEVRVRTWAMRAAEVESFVASAS